MERIIMSLVIALLVSGCSTYATSRYSPSTDNIMALKKMRPATVNVGKFTASEPDKSSTHCRLVGPIATPDDEPFSEYIKKAFTDELKLAELYSPESSILITGNLDEVDSSSQLGMWNLKLTLISSTGARSTTHDQFSFSTGYFGEAACNQTAQAFVPAVQDLLKKAIASPDFQRLIKQ